jgi:hypothetical protein
MSLRRESWSVPFGLLPVFEMNLPEGGSLAWLSKREGADRQKYSQLVRLPVILPELLSRYYSLAINSPTSGEPIPVTSSYP